MKKHHKMLSVGGAVLAVLVIAFLYKRNSKEGNTTIRAAQKLTAKQEEGLIAATFAAIAAFFNSILEMLGLSQAKPAAKIPQRDARTRAEQRRTLPPARRPTPKGASTNNAAPSGPPPRVRPGAKAPQPGSPASLRGKAGRDPKAVAKAVMMGSPSGKDATIPVPAGQAGKSPASAPAPAPAPPGGPAGTESFATMRGGGRWRPRGSIAPM